MKKMNTPIKWLMVLAVTLALVAGCGQKGDLYLPDNSKSKQEKDKN